MNVTVCFFKLGLINYEDLPIPFVITRVIGLLKLSIEYSIIRSFKNYSFVLHL